MTCKHWQERVSAKYSEYIYQSNVNQIQCQQLFTDLCELAGESVTGDVFLMSACVTA